jgi:hypothetical protein
MQQPSAPTVVQTCPNNRNKGPIYPTIEAKFVVLFTRKSGISPG